MKSNKLKGNLMMMLTAFIWGAAFVAQSGAMKYIKPFTFMFARYLVGTVALLPVIWFLSRKKGGFIGGFKNKTLWLGGLFCGIALFTASAFQQYGILYTTTAKAGFITTLYVIFVPIAGLFFRRRPHPIIWYGIALSMVGFYLLTMGDGNFTLQKGDLLVLLGAIGYTFHILIIDHFSPKADGVRMSCIQFLVCAVLGALGMFLFDAPSLTTMFAAWAPIIYAGVFSSGVAYTLQIVAQKFTDPVLVSLIGSLEAVFAALTGYVFWKLGYIGNGAISSKELLGCLLVFCAVILVQLPPPQKEKS